jgi:hypothetical protein
LSTFFSFFGHPLKFSNRSQIAGGKICVNAVLQRPKGGFGLEYIVRLDKLILLNPSVSKPFNQLLDVSLKTSYPFGKLAKSHESTLCHLSSSFGICLIADIETAIFRPVLHHLKPCAQIT